jgi:hypothetical protein
MARNSRRRPQPESVRDALRQLPDPPVLEDNRLYGEIMGRVIHCLAPRDFVERLPVEELTDCRWGMAPYTRPFNAQPQ